MSHYDKLKAARAYLKKHPSIIISILGAALCFISTLVPLPWSVIAYTFIVAGILLSINENIQDDKALVYWQGLATGLADQLRDRQNETGYYQHASAQIDIIETIHGGRVYHGPVTAADIHPALLTDGREEA